MQQTDRTREEGGQIMWADGQGQTTRAPQARYSREETLVTKNPNLTLADLKAQKEGTRMVQASSE